MEQCFFSQKKSCVKNFVKLLRFKIWSLVLHRHISVIMFPRLRKWQRRNFRQNTWLEKANWARGLHNTTLNQVVCLKPSIKQSGNLFHDRTMSAQRQPLLRQHVNSKNFEKVCAAIGS